MEHNSKDSHKNGVKDSINHKNSSTREIQKHKALVKAVKQTVGIPSACAKNLQKTVNNKKIYFWSNEMEFLVEQIRMFQFRSWYPFPRIIYMKHP
jgi:hypothetical protein